MDVQGCGGVGIGGIGIVARKKARAEVVVDRMR